MQEIIINKTENLKRIMLLQDGKLVEYYEEKSEYKRLEGNIYLGKIRNILPGIQAAFVDIGEGKNTFIQVKDLMPKQDQTKETTVQIKDIKEIVKPGMNIIVQVKKDASLSKGARVSTHISLTGKYIVFMPETDIITISKKIENEEKKIKLKEEVQKLLPKNTGAIIRTSAENVDINEIEDEINSLNNEWNKIKKHATENNEIQLLYKVESIESKIIKDTLSQEISKITVDDEEELNAINKILENLKQEKNIKLEKVENALDKYSLGTQIEKMGHRKVYLKCGGFITIDKTEALTAIDVNSGKYTGKENQEATILKVNKEATIEIAKQLRLRDIDGIIIIDYIDMKLEESKKEIQELLKKEIKQDRSKIQILEFTKLNLLELTRKHMFSNKI